MNSFKPLMMAVAFGVTSLSTPAIAQEQAQPQALSIPSGEYVLDKTHASVTFKVMHMGLSNYTARFTGLDATIMLDSAVPTNSTVTATIDAKSVRTDFPFPEKEDFDAIIASKFLGADANPTMMFKSTKLEATGENTARLTGDFTMNGITKPVTLDLTLNAATVHPMFKKPVLGLSATGVIKRSEFGSTFLQGGIGDDVTVEIEAEFGPK